jgi:hypothetical protein
MMAGEGNLHVALYNGAFFEPMLSLGRHISVLCCKFMCISAPRQMLKQQETVSS